MTKKKRREQTAKGRAAKLANVAARRKAAFRSHATVGSWAPQRNLSAEGTAAQTLGREGVSLSDVAKRLGDAEDVVSAHEIGISDFRVDLALRLYREAMSGQVTALRNVAEAHLPEYGRTPDATAEEQKLLQFAVRIGKIMEKYR